jgi:hypothetical protein
LGFVVWVLNPVRDENGAEKFCKVEDCVDLLRRHGFDEFVDSFCGTCSRSCRVVILQLASEGAVLEGGEEGIELGDRFAMCGFEGFDRRIVSCETWSKRK